MMKYLFSLTIAVLLSNPFDLFAQDAMYSKDVFMTKLSAAKEIAVNLQGWEYTYGGAWTQTMVIENESTLSFTRGNVTHSYDLKKLTYLQEEGSLVKLWFR